MPTKKLVDELSYKIIGCAIEVHKQMGPGLLESIYEECLDYELKLRGFEFHRQVLVPLLYKGTPIKTGFRADLIVNDWVVVELKTIESILPIHQAQLLSYMKLAEKPKGLIINFNTTNIAKNGLKAMVNEHYKALPN